MKIVLGIFRSVCMMMATYMALKGDIAITVLMCMFAICAGQMISEVGDGD